jgi:hypothetical protein
VAATYNISADQGSTFLLTITYGQPGAATPTPVDLTGFGARMQVRTAAGDPTALLDASTVNGFIVLGGPAGTININIPATLMTALAAGNYKYDLDIYSSDATPIVTRLIQGSFKLNAEVTVL